MSQDRQKWHVIVVRIGADRNGNYFIFLVPELAGILQIFINFSDIDSLKSSYGASVLEKAASAVGR